MKRMILALGAAVVVSVASADPFGAPPDARHAWAVHDDERPPVRKIVADDGSPPSDAEVLFDGTAKSIADNWCDAKGESTKWTLNEKGELISVAGAGYIFTKARFSDFQLHVEWAAPTGYDDSVKGQARGNSGVFLMGNYEIQVLDSYLTDSDAPGGNRNPNYPDGQAGAVYGQNPPAVNPCRAPGVFNSYDIVFHAPVETDTGTVTRPATVTVLFNGVVVQDHWLFDGPTGFRERATYARKTSDTGLRRERKMPIAFQDHGNPVRFRNIWVRELNRPEDNVTHGDYYAKPGAVRTQRLETAARLDAAYDATWKRAPLARRLLEAWRIAAYAVSAARLSRVDALEREYLATLNRMKTLEEANAAGLDCWSMRLYYQGLERAELVLPNSPVLARLNALFVTETGNDDWTEAVRADLSHGVYTNLDWNANARFFMYPPTFGFPECDVARSYLLQVVDAKGGVRQLESDNPRFSLESLWRELPVGWTICQCLAVKTDDDRNLVMGTRAFWKQAPFTGDYPPAARGYAEFNSRVLAWVFSHPGVKDFVEKGRPDTSKYWGFRYPSKMICALVNALCASAGRDAANRERYLEPARIFADWLISVSEKSGAPLAHFPPTYWCEDLSKEVGVVKESWHEIMLVYPAEVASAYVRLYGATGEKRYLDAARGIGETYLRLQGEDGTVPLKMFKDGRPSHLNRLQPVSSLIPAFEDLYGATKDARYLKAADRAFAFVEAGPMKTANWDGQFEDVTPDAPYANLTKHDAASTVILLCERYPEDKVRIAAAREILRFCEDQFVCWEVPFHGGLPFHHNMQDVAKWTCPGVLEQYYWYVPIDSSASKMIRAYLAMYRVEGNRLDLAKARALANAMTRQQKDDGDVPTHWTGEKGCSWINCILSDVAALEELLSVR